MTFNEIWDEYITQKKKRVKPSTSSAYTATWLLIKDYFGDKEIDSITTKGVEKWALSQLDTLGKKSILDRLILINNIIDYYGYEYEVPVTKIQMKYIRWPSANIYENEVENVKTFSVNDIRLMLNAIAKDPRPRHLLIAIMIGTGIRIGEACALTYGNINLETKSIEITGTLERIRVDDSFTDEDIERMNVKLLRRTKNSAIIISTPKCTASRRAIPIPGELLKILKKLKEVYPAEFYIGTGAYNPPEPRSFRLQYYKLLEKSGVGKHLSPHSLRHTYATTLITSGVDIKTTAALLGHGDTSTTLQVYSHATIESKSKAMRSTVGKQFKDSMKLLE